MRAIVEQSDQQGQKRVRSVEAEQESLYHRCDTVRCSCCLLRCNPYAYAARAAYAARTGSWPPGLYTDSTVVTSNTPVPPKRRAG